MFHRRRARCDLGAGVRAGEGALLMAEELAFEELLGENGAIDGNEGLVRARARVVEQTCGDLLARTALSLKEHGRSRLRNARERLDDGFHRRHAEGSTL